MASYPVAMDCREASLVVGGPPFLLTPLDAPLGVLEALARPLLDVHEQRLEEDLKIEMCWAAGVGASVPDMHPADRVDLCSPAVQQFDRASQADVPLRCGYGVLLHRSGTSA